MDILQDLNKLINELDALNCWYMVEVLREIAQKEIEQKQERDV